MTGTVNKRRTDRMEPNRRETENEKTGRQGGVEGGGLCPNPILIWISLCIGLIDDRCSWVSMSRI